MPVYLVEWNVTHDEAGDGGGDGREEAEACVIDIAF